jgi:hypothetical protein
MNKLTNTKKILITCIVLNVLIFASYGFLLWGIYAKANLASNLVTEAAEDVEKDRTLRLIKASLAENEDFLSHVDSFFIPADGVVDFISLLEQLGVESGVELSIGSVSIDSESESASKEVLSLNIQTEGSWQDTFTFLSLLENLPYRIEFVNTALRLFGATESILFSGSQRTLASEEVWQGTYQVSVHKLR